MKNNAKNIILSILASAALLSSAAQASSTETPSQQEAVSIDLAFVTHLDLGMAEQDVYVELEKGSGEVYRVTAGFHNMDAPLYAAADYIAHDPFNPENIGPYQKGNAMGLTVGQWLKHTGKGTYTYTDGEGKLMLKFTGLVPNGTYTIWHAFLPATPPVPFTGTLDLPLGASDGSESVFTADANGNMEVEHTFKPGLEFSDVWTMAILALNYHSDGKTYGGHPGSFGDKAHIQSVAILPARQGIN